EEMFQLLHDELAKLPERYRGPLVCCVEGQSGDEAARNLGIPLRTFKLRLQQARELLRKRLERRGYAISTARLSMFLFRNMPSATVPPRLTADAVKVAGLISAGKPLASGLVSARIATLVPGAAPVALWTNFKIFLAAVVIGSAVAAGGVVVGMAG